MEGYAGALGDGEPIVSWLVYVLRSTIAPSTGVTSRESSFLLLGSDEPAPERVGKDAVPVLRLVVRWKGGPQEYRYAEPIDSEPGTGPMAGGNYVWSSDSRFRRDVCPYPIPVHDRWEFRDGATPAR